MTLSLTSSCMLTITSTRPYIVCFEKNASLSGNSAHAWFVVGEVGYFMMMLSLLVTLSLILMLLSWMDCLLGWYIDDFHGGVELLAFAHILQLAFMLIALF